MKIFYYPDLSNMNLCRISIPDSSLLKTDNPFFVPDFDLSFSAHAVMAVRVDRLGKSVAARFADRYINEFAAGIVVTADTVLEHLRSCGLPWSAAFDFDKSCITGRFMPISELPAGDEIEMTVHPSETKIRGAVPAFGVFADALETASTYNTMKTGDLLLLPALPATVRLHPGTSIGISALRESLLNVRIK